LKPGRSDLKSDRSNSTPTRATNKIGTKPMYRVTEAQPQHDITSAQAQMVANLIHSLDNSQDPVFLASEIHSSRGMVTINTLVDQLINLNTALNAEYQANGDDDGEAIA
jgi:hypothetical protein